MYDLIGDAAYDVQALWDFARQRRLIPAFAPMRPVEPPHTVDKEALIDSPIVARFESLVT